MQRKLTMVAAALAASMGVATAANAALYTFDLTGSRTANFTLDSTMPSASSAFQSTFNNVSGSFGGSAGVANISFGVAPLIASLNVSTVNLGFTQFAGPQLFTGPTSNPVFTVGTYALSGIVSGSSSLTITQAAAAVPEPASWALLIAGFGMVGVATRRRTRTLTA